MAISLAEEERQVGEAVQRVSVGTGQRTCQF